MFCQNKATAWPHGRLILRVSFLMVGTSTLILSCFKKYSFTAYAYTTKVKGNVQWWLMAQMKAYTMPMKKCTLFCRTFHLRKLFLKT